MYKAPLKIENKTSMENILKEYHDSPIGGHTGIKRMINKKKQKYVWKNMRQIVKKYVNNCKTCTRNKQIRHTKQRLTITDTPFSAFEVLSIDTVGPLRISNSHKYILTIQCDLSKYLIALAMENK